MDQAVKAGSQQELRQFNASVHGSALSFVAGFIDVVGFIALAGLFTAHVTGNFIMIGVEITGNDAGLVAKLIALPVFAASVALTRLAEVRWLRPYRSALAVLLGIECLFLLLFVAAGEWSLHRGTMAVGSAWSIVTGMLAVVAMGIQNALSRTALADLGPTTIMTGNTTQIVIDLIDLPMADAAQAGSIRARLRKMVPAVAGFAAGAILGSLCYAAFDFWSVLLPVLLLIELLRQRLRAGTPVA